MLLAWEAKLSPRKNLKPDHEIQKHAKIPEFVVDYEGTLLEVRLIDRPPDLPCPDRPRRSHPDLDESRPYTREIVNPTR